MFIFDKYDELSSGWKLWRIAHILDRNDNRPTLRSATDPGGGKTTFHYAGKVFLTNLVAGVERPLGNRPVSQTYEVKVLYGTGFPRVTAQAFETGADLVSFDRHFERVEGLVRQFLQA